MDDDSKNIDDACHCGEPLKIDVDHVSFKGGRNAYIICDNCNKSCKIAFEKVEHLIKEPQLNAGGSVNDVVTDEKPEETKQPKLGLIIDAPVTEGEPEKLEETRQLQENGGIIGAVISVLILFATVCAVIYYKLKGENST